ncbi:hypothetical protein RD792_017303 [Penstemon davidsonii]|uniref:Trichome birefringence-like N-terminal domain-containing protein n=1 Tax=Penstemon davidsonii TaxID=160366 RepID=A0ABR0CLN4_9LAMI|nr:hypothetical protein RD792_017303 [Penstemon davidsonii]
MCNYPSVESSSNMYFLGFYKKFKRFRLFEPSIGVLGLTICVIFCFFFLDYKSVAKALMFPSQNERFLWLKSVGESRKKIDFLSEFNGGCDLFDGGWVWDGSYPLSPSRDCGFLDDGFRCYENGRPGYFYTKWR